LILYEKIDAEKGLTKEQAEATCQKVGLCDQPAATIKMLMCLYQLFIKKDALLVEINPYAEDVCLNYYALDAKLKFDDSAKFRQKELFEKRDLSQEDPKEAAATDLDLNYIAMDGSIGCMVNGAGLAMATMDIIKFHGGDPANFLDVGGMATPEKVKEAFKIITMDPKVKTIFVNIFGGIMKCNIIVEGIVKAIKELDMKIPVVVRLQGTNHDQAKKMIGDSKLNIIMREEFDDAAETSVRCAKIMDMAECGHLDAALSMKMECDCTPIPPKKPTTGGIVIIK
jgi:succinyl-CoA synthetase beta subunit